MSTWYIVRRATNGEQVTDALACDGNTIGVYQCPQWTGCAWRYPSTRRDLPSSFDTYEAAAKKLADIKTRKWPHDADYSDAIVHRVYDKAESRQRAEARGDVRALEAVDTYLDGYYRPVWIQMLADAKKRAGIK